MDQETPPSTGAPDGEGRPDQTRGGRLQRWQTLLAAVVTAAAAVIGVLLTRGSDDSEPPRVEPTDEIRQEAYITKVRSGPHPNLPSPAVAWHLEGTFKNLEPGTAVVGLLGPEMAAGNGKRWVVANAVLNRSRGTWTVDLRLRRPAKSIAYQVGTASEELWKECTAETECLAGPRESSPTEQDLTPSPEPESSGEDAHTAEPPPPAEPSGEGDGGELETPVDGLTPTTPLTDTKTGQEYSSAPPGQD
ncbi:hypothetical protein [Streptomyces sp. NPDC056480]|uniref:hypothetical protein n=1 Tax=Streptomyces sp. NPDC056480 TaxID=3345833 RepID=UPI00367B769E